jgi:hypothetical protein
MGTFKTECLSPQTVSFERMKPDRQPDAPGAESRWKGIPQTIWALGFVSMFMVPALMVLMNMRISANLTIFE